jgi:predicted alpha/beta-fold hydrolase
MTEEFRPSLLLRNPHVQTLLGHFWRGKAPAICVRERQVRLPDGDGLMLYDSIPDQWRPGGPIALLVHGLGGCHLSGPVLRVASMLLPRGVRAVRIDLRGSGKGAALARRIYNGGCSGDIRAALAEIRGWDPDSPHSLAGFSLGGNIVLKLAGEAAAEPIAGLERVAAVAPPIDLERCAALISLPRNRIYETHFMRALVRQVRKLEHQCSLESRTRFPRRLSLRVFDDLYTAPRGGFADALDYYRRCSSGPLVPEIRIPTLILSARDDPFIAVEPFESLAATPQVSIRLVQHGGHLGFLAWEGREIVRWAERCVANWIAGSVA